jgi:hypothetical protein
MWNSSIDNRQPTTVAYLRHVGRLRRTHRDILAKDGLSMDGHERLTAASKVWYQP